ncbi:hypothetical protein PH586_09075 [Pseudomonas sp. SA3-5]|uniref:Uncharacterized protein n=1 Tax=Pseudomonas aestuarii TaxID=3018340 RepID=A0ABT4XEB5_9PSED|nr:hypothetical protein [Pseudomonas aestuarii]MDA7086529.1 hypothetical protein [Pseudomonas aestuarii]
MSPAVKAALEASAPLARHIANRPMALGWLSQLEKAARAGNTLGLYEYQDRLSGYLTAMADNYLIQWGVTQQALRDLQNLATTWEQFGQ